jgi:uncharacterized protein YggU (UPF0235/DUF167 family)
MTINESHSEGTIISVRAFAGSRRNEVRNEPDGTLKVWVTQIPEKGKANDVIRKLLAKHLRLRASQVELLSGSTSPQKKFLLRNVTKDDN